MRGEVASDFMPRNRDLSFEISIEARDNFLDGCVIEQKALRVRRKLHRAIEPVRSGVADPETLNRREVDVGSECSSRDRAPSFGHCSHVRNGRFAR